MEVGMCTGCGKNCIIQLLKTKQIFTGTDMQFMLKTKKERQKDRDREKKKERRKGRWKERKVKCIGL